MEKLEYKNERAREKRETIVLPFNPELDFDTLEFWWDSGVSEGSDFHDGRLSPGGKPAWNLERSTCLKVIKWKDDNHQFICRSLHEDMSIVQFL